WFKECPNCHNRVLRSLDVCNFCNYNFNKGYKMKKVLVILLAHYFPAKNFGGPAVSIYNLVNRISGYYSIYLITNNYIISTQLFNLF
ncbi:MAG: hypothetical protein WCX73_04055, partial [Candidatus Pacearchaeota archaeon]